MKTYKSQTKNKGTTIILESVQQAIEMGNLWYEKSPGDKFGDQFSFYNKQKKDFEGFKECCEAITKGDEEFKKEVNEMIEHLVDLVDSIKPIFSKGRQGVKFVEEGGFDVAPSLAATGEPKLFIDETKHGENLIEKPPASGEGAYRLVINTDVWWGGDVKDNCAMIGALIEILQRNAAVEIWIQQGWLGGHPSDGVTLFKLDYTMSSDISSLVFWISHPGKDIPFSMAVNRGLGRKSSATSCALEIVADMMLRGDLMSIAGFSQNKMKNALFTEKIDMMCAWISKTAYSILFEGPQDGGDWISEDRDSLLG